MDCQAEDRPSRVMRADAQRNRDKLVEAAQAAFREHGAQASLDDIARRAGVGPGTLYRHFPTRDDLIDAVMRDWAARVDAESDAVIASGLEPRAALEEWFDRFVAYIGIYRGTAAKVVAAMDDETSPIHQKCQLLAGAHDKVIAHVAASGGLREGVDSREVMRLVSGAAGVADQAGMTPDEVRPMLQIVVRGILREPTAS